MKKRIPKIYCDTSFILEYWEAYTFHEDSSVDRLRRENEPAHYDFIKSIIKTERKIEAIKPLRRLIDRNDIEIELISSAFGLLEIYEKHAEWNMKHIIAESTNLDRALNKGKKQIGDYIEKIFKSDDENSKLVFRALLPNNLNEDLFGIEFIDIENLNLPISDFHNNYSLFSILQVGATDIMHLIAACHLKADYFISFDSDFKRIKEVVEKHMDLKMILNMDELDNLLNTTANSQS